MPKIYKLNLVFKNYKYKCKKTVVVTCKTMCKAHSKVAHIKQQNPLKGRGYNKGGFYYIQAFQGP